MALQNLLGDLALDASVNTLLKPASTLAAITAITNVVHVDDNGGTLTVDGTVAATNAGLTALAGAIAGTEVQVDVLTMPTVTVTGALTDAQLRATAVPISVVSVPSHAVTNAGTFATQSTLAAETTKIIGTVNVAASQTIAITSTDIATLAGAVAATHMQVDVLSMPAGGSGLTDAELRATAVPVSGTVTVNLSATDNAVLDTLATETTLGTVHGHVDSIDTKTPTLGQALAASSVPVILPAATIITLTPPAAIMGFATSVKQLADGHSVALSATDNAVLDSIDANTDSGAVVGTGACATAQRVHLADESLTALENITVISSGTVTANAGTNLNTSALALETGGNLAAIKAKTDNIPALGQALAAASIPIVLTAAQITILTPPAQGLTDAQLRATAIPVSLASVPTHGVTGTFYQATQPVSGTVNLSKSSTGTSTNVSASITNVTLLAENAARKGATIYNDSTAILGLKLGATASATSFTVKMQPDAYYELPFGYTGIIDGIWIVASGSARITEFT